MVQSLLEALPESLLEIGTLALFALGSGALTVIGLLAELTAVENVSAGHLMSGLWLLAFGGIVLAGGVLVSYREIYLRLRRAA